ncbi:hypothetical protein L9F63_020747, partial [Diploptera punctata]
DYVPIVKASLTLMLNQMEQMKIFMILMKKQLIYLSQNKIRRLSVNRDISRMVILMKKKIRAIFVDNCTIYNLLVSSCLFTMNRLCLFAIDFKSREFSTLVIERTDAN